jgi:hypothetical protein
MGFLLLSAADKAMDMRNKYYDGQIKQIELQLKQEEINKIRRGSETKAPEELEKQSQIIIASVLKQSLHVCQHQRCSDQGSVLHRT